MALRVKIEVRSRCEMMDYSGGKWELLRSHENKACPICIHPEAKNISGGQMVASAIVNLAEMSLSVTLGNPCRSRYEKFYL